MMTKKHFEEIAKILLSARREFGDREIIAEQVVHSIEHDLATMFKSVNDRFDEERFKDASRESG